MRYATPMSSCPRPYSMLSIERLDLNGSYDGWTDSWLFPEL